MARPLRYEAAGAVYHVMARGDGGREVFETDVDRRAWLEKLEEVSGSHGWRIHAYVLMGNHFHLLLETPEPNLVSGMKWLMGVYSQGWNRRRKRRGHVFQGRYKSVVVSGEGKGQYFRMVADYIHLNPVRSGWVGGTTGRRLRDWRWSSFPYYGRRKAPVWLETGRVLRAFRLSDDRRGGRAYGSYLEARAADREATLNDVALSELRRGWYLGPESFGQRIARALEPVGAAVRKRASVGGAAVRAHDEQEALRLLRQGSELLGLPSRKSELVGHGRWVAEKSLLAALVRRRTGVRNAWLAERLGMNHEVNVTAALRRVRESRDLTKRLVRLEREMEDGER